MLIRPLSLPYTHLIKLPRWSQLLCYALLTLANLCVVQVAFAAPAVNIVEAEMEANFDFRAMLKAKDAKALGTPANVLLGYQEKTPGAGHLMVGLTAQNITLSRIAAGKTTVLAKALRPNLTVTEQGTPLVIQWRNGGVRVIYGGHILLRAERLGMLKGAVATQRVNEALEFADPICQPVEEVHYDDDFMRAEAAKDLWQTASGSWQMNSIGEPSRGANPFAYVGQGKPAITVAGRWFWNDYTASVSARPLGEGAMGLVVYWQDASNCILFKWFAEETAQWHGKERQLWQIVGGKHSLLAAAPGGYRPKQWYRLATGVRDGLVSVAIDGQTIVQKRVDFFGQGKVGLYASQTEVMFDDVMVRSGGDTTASQTAYAEVVTPQFTQEETMKDWANPKGEWLRAKESSDGDDSERASYWHRGVFFGNHSLELNASGVSDKEDSITALLCGDGESIESGYRLEVTPGTEGKLKVALLRQGKAVTTPQSLAKPQSDKLALKIERKGNTIRGYVNNQMLVSFTDANPLPGRRAGYRTQGASAPRKDAAVNATHVYDYTFYRAPTDWMVGSGTWDVASRWMCSPGWSWYGGWSDRIASLWNKRSFAGDFAVEVFAACKMDSVSEPHYLHPRDINITVAGDGRDLASGYSFLFGGWNNTFTRIMRGTQPVAETKDVLLPKNYHNDAHRKWFCLRVEKTGDTISYYVDRKLALRYRDPQPLTGKRLALWTCGNGVMIARATIYYEKELGIEAAHPLLPFTADITAIPANQVENLGWRVRNEKAPVRLEAVGTLNAGVSKGQASSTKAIPALRAINLDGDGKFAVAAQTDPFDALKTPKLSFECRLAPGTDINLYLKVKGDYHSIRLTGPSKENDKEGVKLLGTLSDVRDDGKWHPVAVDLAALLKPLYADEKQLMVEELFFGNLTRDPYRQAGFGGNYPGTHYLVRGLALRSADNRLATLRLATLIEPKLRGVSEMRSEPRLVSTQPSVIIPPPVKLDPKARGVFNLKAYFCKDPDKGEFKEEMLNKEISWTAFSKHLFARQFETIDFDWTTEAAKQKLPKNYFSARFIGKLVVAEEGDYTFYLDRLDDGGRLYIDGKLAIDAWLVQAAATHSSQAIRLGPGVHDIRLDFCQGPGLGSVTLSWSGANFGKEVIPKTTKPEVVEPQRIAGSVR